MSAPRPTPCAATPPLGVAAPTRTVTINERPGVQPRIQRVNHRQVILDHPTGRGAPCAQRARQLCGRRRAGQERLQIGQAPRFDIFRYLIDVIRGRGAGPRAVLEGERLRIADLRHQIEGCGKVVLALAGKADDKIRRQRNVRTCGADLLYDAQVAAGVVAPVHRL